MANALWLSGLDNNAASKRFAFLTLLWSLEFVIHPNLDYDTIVVNKYDETWQDDRKT